MATRWVGVLTYPLILASAVASAVLMLGAGWSPGTVVAANGLGFGLLVFGLERAFPGRPAWRLDPGEAGTDLLHAVLSNPIPSAIFRSLAFGGIAQASDAISARLGMGLWPDGWPLLAQAGLALLVAEAASYAIHRFLHESRLWPLHAVHHCSPRMYFLLSVRKHPLQAFVTYGGRLTVLWLLGIPADTLAVLLVLTTAHSYVQHANLPYRTGALGWVFATPELHRVHHSRREEELGANYGDVLIVYDVLCGTRREPRAEAPEVGLPGIEVPQTYWSHLRLPFEWARLNR